MIKNDILKIKILKQYKAKNISYTASILSNLVESKFETVKRALKFFINIGVVEKEIKEHGKKFFTYYNLTEIGINLIKSQKI